MPRLSPTILRRAAQQSSWLPHLLRECRDLGSARNELRWLKESITSTTLHSCQGQLKPKVQQLRQHVKRRSRGEPLQYILGNQPFGELDILCRPKVLIPRPETEVYISKTAELIAAAVHAGQLGRYDDLCIADLCTGTGCIALLLHSLLRPVRLAGDDTAGGSPPIHILAVDVSWDALRLANINLRHNLSTELLHDSAQGDVQVRYLDVLQLGLEAAQSHPSISAYASINSAAVSVATKSPTAATSAATLTTSSFLAKSWPVIVSNPPYISPSDFSPGGTTARSVRKYEPKLALVPPRFSWSGSGHDGGGQFGSTSTYVKQADQFYAALLYTAHKVGTELLVMEVGDHQQSERVADLALQILGTQIRSNPKNETEESEAGVENIATRTAMLLEIWHDDGSVERYDSDSDLRREAGRAGSSCKTATERREEASPRAMVVWRGLLARWREDNPG